MSDNNPDKMFDLSEIGSPYIRLAISYTHHCDPAMTSDSSIVVFYDDMHAALKAFFLQPQQKHVPLLLKALFAYTEENIATSTSPYPYWDEVKNIAELLLRHDGFSCIDGIEQRERLLASLCIAKWFLNEAKDDEFLWIEVAPYLTDSSEEATTDNHLNELLHAWLGVPMEESAHFKLEDVVDALNGKGAWDLYGENEEERRALHSIFYQHNLPVKSLHNQDRAKKETAPVVAMPQDLS